MNAPTAPAVYAGFWRRLGAFAIDYLVLLAAGIVVALFLPPNDERIGLVVLLLWLGYKVSMESSPFQATVGKRVLDIKVTDTDGERIGMSRALVRCLASVLSGLMLYIGFVMAGFTRRRQALHDLMADTLVVRKALTPAEIAGADDAPSVSGWVIAALLLLAMVPALGMVSLVAIPAYQDRTIRDQVWQGVLMKNKHQNVVQAMWESGRFDFDEIGSSTVFADLPGAGRYVESIEIKSSIVTITYGSEAAAAISGRRLAFVPVLDHNKRLWWICGYARPRPGHRVIVEEHARLTDVPPNYLPEMCR